MAYNAKSPPSLGQIQDVLKRIDGQLQDLSEFYSNEIDIISEAVVTILMRLARTQEDENEETETPGTETENS